ncbi:MAG: RNA polymerase sigma factor, partial [Myxococcota bacterium]|nr:RNA polymerase sigma factor [Myxococcota bacterium]
FAVTVNHREALEQVMVRYARGEDAAFAELFQRLSPLLAGYLKRLCGSRELARDLVQETFLCIHRGRAQFESGRGVERWAYAIARNCFISHVRLSRSRLASVSHPLDELQLASGLDGDGEAVLAAREAEERAVVALQGLPRSQREAFVLLRLQGESVHDAAERLGISQSAVKLRAFRAGESMREAFAQQSAA